MSASRSLPPRPRKAFGTRQYQLLEPDSIFFRPFISSCQLPLDYRLSKLFCLPFYPLVLSAPAHATAVPGSLLYRGYVCPVYRASGAFLPSPSDASSRPDNIHAGQWAINVSPASSSSLAIHIASLVASISVYRLRAVTPVTCKLSTSFRTSGRRHISYFSFA